MIRLFALALVLASAAVAGPAHAQVWADGRDQWTLLPRKLINRNLFDQLSAPGQESRLGAGLDFIAAAVDGTVSGQIPIAVDERTRFHGYFVFDSFVAFRPLDGLEVNLNVTLLNPSASDGYRSSAQVLPGLSLHLQRDLMTFGGDSLRFDLLVFDLDLTTIGEGLILEEVPLEGYAGSLSWGGLRLEAIFAGRVFFLNDDLWTYALSAFDGALELSWTAWLRGGTIERVTADIMVLNGAELQGETIEQGAHLINLSGHWEPLTNLRLAAELSLRVREHPRAAALIRIDYLNRSLSFVELHAGYQARFYQQGFGPDRQLGGMTTLPGVPDREDTYVTNSFELFGLSRYFDQWSHTAMVEMKAEIFPGVALVFEGEYWLRVMTDPRQQKRVVILPRGGRAPGVVHDFFYRGGVEIRPWPEMPHRLRGLVTNKLVESGQSSVEFVLRRFSHTPLFVFEAEVRL